MAYGAFPRSSAAQNLDILASCLAADLRVSRKTVDFEKKPRVSLEVYNSADARLVMSPNGMHITLPLPLTLPGYGYRWGNASAANTRVVICRIILGCGKSARITLSGVH